MILLSIFLCNGGRFANSKKCYFSRPWRRLLQCLCMYCKNNKKYNPKGRNKFGFEIFFGLLVWYSAMKNIWIKQFAAAVHIFELNFHFWNVPAFFPIPSIFMCKHSPMCFVMSRQKCVKTKQLHLTPFLIVPTPYTLCTTRCYVLETQRPLL